MAIRTWSVTASVAVLLAGCSFGPKLQTRLPQVRDVPVLAGLSPQESLARGRTFLASKNYGLAIELFKTAGRDPALEVDSLNGLAIAYDGIGRADLAERYFQKALALRSDDERTRRNLATFYATSGQQEKRRALLASAEAKPTAEKAVGASDEAAPGPVFAAIVAAPAETVSRAGLDAFSPLGSAFRPLLVSASLPSSRPATTDRPGASRAAVVCTGDLAGAASTPADGTMIIFRLSVGEVFIAAQPAGETCYLDGGAAAAAPAQQVAISNKDYLGLLAAYLDQMNRMQRFAELPRPSRAVL